VLLHLGQGTSISFTPCSPTSVWEESFLGQPRASAVVTFPSVVSPKPRPVGLVAGVRSDEIPSRHFLSVPPHNEKGCGDGEWRCSRSRV
jgi:hypothetical protein